MLRETITAFFAALSSPVLTQDLGRELVSGVALTAAAATDQQDFYHFTALPGTKVEILAVSTGKITTDVYDAAGNLLESGPGRATLIVPLAERYTVAIARTGPARPYRITATMAEPTPTQRLMATEVGYEIRSENTRVRSCWVKPGVEIRIDGDMIGTAVLAADGKEFIVALTKPTMTFRMWGEIDAEGLTRLQRALDVPKTSSAIFSLADLQRGERTIGYVGYRCPTG